MRDTVIDDKEIKEGDYMGIGDSSILSVGADREDVTKDMVAQMIDEESSFICIYYGEEVLPEAVNALQKYFEGGCDMSERYTEIRKNLKEKINGSGECEIETDEEYFYAVGQTCILFYFFK